MAEYCAKHDKVFREGETCFGCDTEKEKLAGPDDTIAALRTSGELPHSSPYSEYGDPQHEVQISEHPAVKDLPPQVKGRVVALLEGLRHFLKA